MSSEVYTSDEIYVAPADVMTIHLTGSTQNVSGNDSDNVIWSDNTSNLLYGLGGDDLFHLGRAGDRVYGGAGHDTFAYAETPWAGGDIYDFTAEDRIDVAGLLARAGYGGSDAVGDGYLKLTQDGSIAQLWANYNQPGNDGWWLVASLHGVDSSNLQVSGGVVTLAGSAGGGTEVYTAEEVYVAPAGVTTIHLTGSTQNVSGNDGDNVFWSDNTSNIFYGKYGDDLFHLGRAGDRVYGGAGHDTFAFAETPWAGSEIYDFTAEDKVDLTGLLARSGYGGSDAVADGYLKVTQNGTVAQLWANYNQPGNDGWWLVTNLYGVDSSDLTVSGGIVTLTSDAPAPTGSVSTSAPAYNAPDDVATITLTGSHQTVAGNRFDNVIWSNNTGNRLYGMAGDDVLHLGRGGDQAWGNDGHDVFAFAETPWAGASINDFESGDRIDLTGLLARAGYGGSDALADGYLKLTGSSAGAQVWANYNQPGNDGWWLVATVQSVDVASLHYAGGVIS